MSNLTAYRLNSAVAIFWVIAALADTVFTLATGRGYPHWQLMTALGFGLVLLHMERPTPAKESDGA